MTIQLMPFTYFALPHSPPHLATTTLFSVSTCLFWFWLFINFLFFLYSTHAWSHMVFLFFWLISLSKVTSRYIHVVTNDKVHLFLVACLLTVDGATWTSLDHTAGGWGWVERELSHSAVPAQTQTCQPHKSSLAAVRNFQRFSTFLFMSTDCI